MFDAKSKDHLQILVQPVAITVVATQLALLLPPAGIEMICVRYDQGEVGVGNWAMGIDLFQSLYPQPPWFQWVNCEVAFPT